MYYSYTVPFSRTSNSNYFQKRNFHS